MTNAASLLQYTAEQGLNVYGFELSNEDNTPSLAEQDGKNVYIDPTVGDASVGAGLCLHCPAEPALGVNLHGTARHTHCFMRL